MLFQYTPGSGHNNFGFEPYLCVVNVILTTFPDVNACTTLMESVKTVEPKYKRTGGQHFRTHLYCSNYNLSVNHSAG